jgi:hypothetical protein
MAIKDPGFGFTKLRKKELTDYIKGLPDEKYFFL